ncbi:hypothetical protein OROGR_031902 [Orobanche gracilis]
MKKLVLKLDLQNDKDEQRRALKTVSTLSDCPVRIDEISIDLQGKTLTVIGTVDPVSVVSKLRKNWPTDIISVGPAKEPEKKEEPKKEDPKKKDEPKEEEAKEEAKKGEPKGEEAKKDEEPKKEEEKKVDHEMVLGTVLPYRTYKPYYHPPPPMNTYYQVHHSIEENPNACVIC